MLLLNVNVLSFNFTYFSIKHAYLISTILENRIKRSE